MTTEIDSSLEARTERFRLKGAFSGEAIVAGSSELSFQVWVAFLDHHTPCLGFTIKECTHLNVGKNRLAELGARLSSRNHGPIGRLPAAMPTRNAG